MRREQQVFSRKTDFSQYRNASTAKLPEEVEGRLNPDSLFEDGEADENRAPIRVVTAKLTKTAPQTAPQFAPIRVAPQFTVVKAASNQVSNQFEAADEKYDEDVAPKPSSLVAVAKPKQKAAKKAQPSPQKSSSNAVSKSPKSAVGTGTGKQQRKPVHEAYSPAEVLQASVLREKLQDMEARVIRILTTNSGDWRSIFVRF